MSAMPDQTPLPFPEPDTPGPAPETPARGTEERVRTPYGKPAKTGGRPWWSRLLGQLLDPWIGLKLEPEAPGQYADGRPVCYVLEDYGLSNALILDRACREAGLPSPLQPLPGDPLGRKRAYVALSRRNASALSPAGPAPGARHSGSLARLLEAHRDYPELDVQLVPVSIFVGRAPDRDSGWFSVLFSENWALVGRFRRLLAILLNGRNTHRAFRRRRCRCAKHRRGRPAARTHRAQTLARAAHPLPPHPRGGDRPGPVDAASAGRQGAGLRAGARSHRRLRHARQQQTGRRLEESARLRLGNRRRLFASGGAFGQLPADHGVEPHLPRRARAPSGTAEGSRAGP